MARNLEPHRDNAPQRTRARTSRLTHELPPVRARVFLPDALGLGFGARASSRGETRDAARAD